nr:uncharacterized protein LOC109168214 [Ipomoea batatas]
MRSDEGSVGEWLSLGLGEGEVQHKPSKLKGTSITSVARFSKANTTSFSMSVLPPDPMDRLNVAGQEVFGSIHNTTHQIHISFT